MSRITQAHAPTRDTFHQQCPDPLRTHNQTARVLREFVWRRANLRNDHAMLCIVGREGSGKSHTALSIAEKVDQTFTAERVFFHPDEFLEYVNSGDTGTGEAIVLDESGVGLGVRSWYDQAQILFNQALQTIRDDNLIILTTLPRLSELDSQTRGRLHAFLEMTDLRPGRFARFKWKHVKPKRDEDGGLLKFYPRLYVGGRLRRVTQLSIGPPTEPLAEDYEGKKSEFKVELYEETVGAIREDTNGHDDSVSEKDIAEAIKDEGIETVVSEHPTNGSHYIDKDIIKMEYDTSKAAAKRIKKLLRRDDEVAV